MKRIVPADSPLCRHFLVGSCNYGDLCKFIHQVQPAEAVPDDVCKHFKKGRCAFDQECRFKHLGAGGTLPENNSLKQSIKLQTTLHQHIPATRDFLDATNLYTNLDSKNDDPKTAVCRHYMKNRCTYEKNCRFNHPDNPNLERPVAKSDAPCRHFLRGRCTYGVRCSFSHPATHVSGIVNSVKQENHSNSNRANDNYGDPPRWISHAAPTSSAPRESYYSAPSYVDPPPTSYRPPSEQYYRRNNRESTNFRHCPYVSTSSSVAKPERDVCRHYLRNQCSYGQYCSFLHV